MWTNPATLPSRLPWSEPRPLRKLGVHTFAEVVALNDGALVELASKLKTSPIGILEADWREHAREQHEQKYGETL